MANKFSVIVPDGQGKILNCGSPVQAVKQAAKFLGCSKDDIHIINAWNLGGSSYLFNSKDEGADYWLSILKLDGTPGFVGKPNV